MTTECEICGKEFNTTQGLRGHKTFVHGITKNKSDIRAEPATDWQLRGQSKEPGNELIEQPRQPTGQQENVTDQLELLRDANEEFRRGLGEQDDKIEYLREKLENSTDNLDDILKQGTELVDSRFSTIGVEIDAIKRQVTQQRQILGQLEEQSQVNKVLEDQRKDQLDSVVKQLSNIQSELSRVRNLAIRQPSGEMLSDHIFGDSEHQHKAYRSPEGLTQPYRYSQDPVSGDRWIDLSEPED
jgi:hypothetical protein